MPAFDALDLADMHAMVDEAMDKTADVYRSTSVSDGLGSYIHTPTIIVAAAPCRVYTSDHLPEATTVAGQTRDGIPWSIVFTPGTDVQQGDKIVVDTHEYLVMGVRSDRSYDMELIATCIRAS